MKPQEVPNDEEGNPFSRLSQLLAYPRTVSIATLATAIEEAGIYSWDKYGRFKKFDKNSPENSLALALLAEIHTYEQAPDATHSYEDRHPLESCEDDWDNPFAKYGWASKVMPDFEAIVANQIEIPDAKKPPGKKREETSYLNIIGALLAYIAGGVKGVGLHPSFSNEMNLIETIEAQYKGTGGLSKSNLSRRFPQAKRSLNSV